MIAVGNKRNDLNVDFAHFKSRIRVILVNIHWRELELSGKWSFRRSENKNCNRLLRLLSAKIETSISCGGHKEHFSESSQNGVRAVNGCSWFWKCPNPFALKDVSARHPFPLSVRAAQMNSRELHLYKTNHKIPPHKLQQCAIIKLD